VGVDLEEREGGWGRSLVLLEAVDDGKLFMLVSDLQKRSEDSL
jgi:hypothetical protein